MLAADELGWPLPDEFLGVGAEAGQDVTVAVVATVAELAWPHDHGVVERPHNREEDSGGADRADEFGDPFGGVLAAAMPGAGDDDPLDCDPPRQDMAGYV